jgi:hypothetical protein
MKRIFPIIALALSSLVGCYNNHGCPPQIEFSAHANHSIAQLRAICQDECVCITQDIVCIGRITSSDKEGNFYRSVVIEDESGAAEIKLGLYNISSQLPVGLKVALYLNGTAIMVENGVVVVGLPPQSFDNAPREMESWEVIDKHITRSNSVVAPQPQLAEIAYLDISQCGRLIRIENLLHSPLDNSEEGSTIEGYHRFVDQEGNAIFIYSSPYAEFADFELPTTEITIQGVLYHEAVGMNIGRQFTIKPRYKDDITTVNSAI